MCGQMELNLDPLGKRLQRLINPGRNPDKKGT